jgi:hypothetical protein
MFRKNFIPVWLGILVLSSMFLMGQQTWSPQVECTLPEDCEDGNPCTDIDCIGYTCVYTNNNNPCDDDDACTSNDTCSGGNCIPGFPYCDDGDPCTLDNCTDMGGTPICSHIPIC